MPTDRPWLTFDDTNGTPRVHIPLQNGGDMSVACSVEGLADFITEARNAVLERSQDPEFQKKLGGALLRFARNMVTR